VVERGRTREVNSMWGSAAPVAKEMTDVDQSKPSHQQGQLFPLFKLGPLARTTLHPESLNQIDLPHDASPSLFSFSPPVRPSSSISLLVSILPFSLPHPSPFSLHRTTNLNRKSNDPDARLSL
jgi:hypothetical protein